MSTDASTIEIEPETSPRRLKSIVILFTTIIILIFSAMGAWLSWVSYNNEIHQTEAYTSNLVISAAQHAEDAIKELEAFSSGMVERIEWYGIEKLDTERLHKVFVNQANIMRQIHGVFIYDSEGRWLVTS